MSFSSEMMGWAVGEAEDTRGRNVIYQYPYPNFTIASEPEVRAVRPGQIVEYNLAVSSMGGMDTNVSLDVFSKPTGVNVTLSSSTINNNMGTTISVSTAPSLAMGEYQITMRARADYWTGDVYLPIERHFKLRLIVTPYPVSAVMPDHGVAGTEVTILGDNFGGSAAGNEIWLAGSRLPAAAILAWSNSSIRVRMPTDPAQLRVLFPDGPQAGKVQVIIGGVESNANLTFQAESQITHITGEVTLQKVIATVHGTLLGPDPGSMNRSTIWEHLALGNTWIDYVKVTSWSDSAITFETSVRTPQSYLRVTSNGYESNPLVFNLALKDIYLPSVLKNFRR
jgi:hypothetical protein